METAFVLTHLRWFVPTGHFFMPDLGLLCLEYRTRSRALNLKTYLNWRGKSVVCLLHLDHGCDRQIACCLSDSVWSHVMSLSGIPSGCKVFSHLSFVASLLVTILNTLHFPSRVTSYVWPLCIYMLCPTRLGLVWGDQLAGPMLLDSSSRSFPSHYFVISLTFSSDHSCNSRSHYR